MGCKDFVLVDNDVFDRSNLTRTYGSRFSDTDQTIPKTSIAKRNLSGISPDVSVREVKDSIINQETLLELRGRDIIFSCTDNDLSRSLLNRYAYQYSTP